MEWALVSRFIELFPAGTNETSQVMTAAKETVD
jgi:hypothetical protein